MSRNPERPEILIVFDGKPGRDGLTADQAAAYGVQIGELRRDVDDISAFVGFDGGSNAPAGAPGATTNIVGTPVLGGVNWTWTLAADNGSALQSQYVVYTVSGQVFEANLNGTRTSFLVPTPEPSSSVTFTIQATNGAAPGPVATTDAVVSWGVPSAIAALDYIRQEVGFADVSFTAAVSPDTPVTGYPFRIVRTTGDQSETTGVLPATAREIRVDLPSDDETVDLYIRARNAVGDGPEFGPFNVAGVTVPTGVAAPTVTPTPGGLLISSNGVSADGGAVVESWIIETTP